MIPDFQTLLLPVLRRSAQGPVKVSDLVEPLGTEFALSSDEMEALTPDQKDGLFRNRIGWARAYLKQANLIESPQWGYFQITADGQKLLENPPAKLDVKYLRTIPAYANHVPKTRKAQNTKATEADDSGSTPEERLQSSYEDINASVSDEIVERLQTGTPAFFERAIVSLLIAMGYGVDDEAGNVIGRSGDGGVDGVIDQDPLGVDQIYIQAKRYATGNNVGSGAIRDFFGSLNIKKAQKGIFVTTSDFSNEALKTARELSSRIVLINGHRLGELMIKHNVGCRDHQTFIVKKIDEGFFE
jgi:restriction system protein